MLQISPKELYCTMQEIIRGCSEPSAVNVSDRLNYQRQRSNNTSWLDWAADARRYLDSLSFNHVRSMEVVYWEPENLRRNNNTGMNAEKREKVIKWATILADEGLEKWYKSLPDQLIATGNMIAVRVY